MSLYQVQLCLFDHLRALEKLAVGAERPGIAVSGYRLTEREREALLASDVGVLYEMGTHPVLVNALCRAEGWKRADYRVLFDSAGAPASPFSGRPRWQTS